MHMHILYRIIHQWWYCTPLGCEWVGGSPQTA